MEYYVLDARNIPVKDRVVPPKQGVLQHIKILLRVPFNIKEIQVEVHDESSLRVECVMNHGNLRTIGSKLYILVPNTGGWPPNVEDSQVDTGRRGKDFSHDTASILGDTFIKRIHFPLNVLVGCQPLEILRRVLEKGKVPDMGGPYNSGAILLAALARGPMATRLVLEYGASRFLKNNRRVSLQALIHYSCLGDPKTNRTAHLLWQEGVLQPDDLPELEKTLSTYRNIDRKLKKFDFQTMERVAAMVEAVKTPPSLQQLAKNALCKALGPMPGRRQKVRDMNIGGYVEKQLLFADAMDTRREHFSIAHNCSFVCKNGCVDFDRYIDYTGQRLLPNNTISTKSDFEKKLKKGNKRQETHLSFFELFLFVVYFGLLGILCCSFSTFSSA